MIRRFTTEDRSLSNGMRPDSKTHIENQSLQDIEHLVDLTPEQFDDIANMGIGIEKLIDGWIYIKRTQ